MNTIIVNGKRIQVQGANVSIINNKVFVDGKEVVDGLSGVVEIKWEGPLASLTSDASVTCGEVAGNVDAGGSVIAGNVKGNVDAGGSVNCDNIGGSVDAGGSVNCDFVKGDVDAGGSVTTRR